MFDREVLRSAVLPAYLLLAVVLGGASAAGYWSNLALQLFGIILIVPAIASRKAMPSRMLGWIVLAGLFIVVCQFVPLPAGLWKVLPRRAEILASSHMAGVEPHPLFWTLAPYDAIKSAVWLLPCLAVFLTARARCSRPTVWSAWAIAGAMTLSVAVGALQVAGGPRSGWYFYEITNRATTVGFFANANHLATLLLVTIPFLAAVIKVFEKTPRFHLVLSLAAACLLIDLAGIFVNGSLFGYGLVLPVIAASLLILVPRASFRRWTAAILISVVVAGVVFIFATPEGQRMLADSSTITAHGRSVIFTRTWTAIKDFAPTGSGLGTFVQIYTLYENPVEAGRTFVNHAHNDYLELFLETGIAGAMVLLAFLVWWARKAFEIWHNRHINAFAGAAVIGSAVILVHSLVDYPLRTASISCIFALCCAQIACWRPAGEKQPEDDRAKD